MRTTSRRRLITSSSLLMLGGGARAAEPLVVTAFPNVDRMIRAALPQWQLRNPGAEVRVVSRAYPDHHTAMTTALSTSGHLPDLMALETSYLGGFALGGGLLDLSEPPFEAGRLANEFAPFAFALAHNRAGRVVALPADIGPGSRPSHHWIPRACPIRAVWPSVTCKAWTGCPTRPGSARSAIRSSPTTSSRRVPF
jgi:multiple sugar transport system substrate-binding protein